MGSKGRILPHHLRHPLPGPDMGHPDPFGPGICPPLGSFPPYDMLPPPKVMEQNLAAQRIEMQRLLMENQRLAATHGTLRQVLAGAQHELQMLHAQIGALKSERDYEMRSMMDKIDKMEADMQAEEPIKLELQKAQAEAQNLVAARQELVSKAQQLSQDLQRAHAEAQQLPVLMSELDGLRQEYEHCRATYDYEKKLYNDHLESLQLMENNYIAVAREVEKLRGELMNPAYAERRPVAPYGTPGNNENEASGHFAGENAYEEGYGVSQGRAPLAASSAGASAIGAASGTPTYGLAQSGPTPARPGYDAPRGPGYNAAGVPAYDSQRVHGYEPQRGPGYDAQLQRGTNYDAQRTGYDPQRGLGYDVQRGAPGYDPSRVGNYDAQFRGAAGPHGHVTPINHVTTPPSQPAAHGGNPVR